jgi:hypothetical protein
VTQFFPEFLGKLFNFTQQVLEQRYAWSNDLNIMVSNKITHVEINAEVVEKNILLSLLRNRETKSTTNKDLKN